MNSRYTGGLLLILAACLVMQGDGTANVVGRSGTTGPVATIPGGYSQRLSGELKGSATAEQGPDIPAKLIRYIAETDNTGSFFFGGSSSVTVSDGTTDTTTGFRLGPGGDTGWIPTTNASDDWRISTDPDDSVTYWILN